MQRFLGNLGTARVLVSSFRGQVDRSRGSVYLLEERLHFTHDQCFITLLGGETVLYFITFLYDILDLA